MLQKYPILLVLSLSLSSPYLSANPVPRQEQGNLVMEGIPEIPQRVKDQWLPYENARSASFQSWLPGGDGVLITTRFGESQQLHKVLKPLAYRQQLSFFNEPIGMARAHPEHTEILYTKDQGGNENSQVYLYNLLDGKSRLLTDGQSRHESPLWNNKGDTLAYAGTQRNGRDTDVYIQDRKEGNPALRVVEQEGSWSPIAFSPDDKKLLVMQTRSAVDNRLYVLDLASKILDEIPRESQAYFGSAIWSKDGQRIYVTSNQNEEFKRLYELDLKSQKLKLLSSTIPWDIEDITLTADGKTLVFSANQDGTSQLYQLDLASKRIRELNLAPGLSVQIANIEAHPRQADLIAFSMSHSQSSGDVYVLNLKTSKASAWTQSEIGGLDPKNLTIPQLFRYPSFDQVNGQARQIPAYIYRAKNKTGRTPVVIHIHGGPEAQFRPGFNPSFQYYTQELGISVIAPNVRGSSGYGKTYLNLDNGFLREDLVKDIGALLDWIGKQPDLDANRVLVMGGSYGGYMTLASLVYYSDRLAGGINTVGISHFLSFLKNTKSYRQDLRRVEYGDERDPAMRAFLDRISPLTQVDKIRKPLFVVQGLNDPRVPASEAEQIVKAVREKGVPVWYLLAKDEGHGFRKKSNQVVNLYTVGLFMEQVLKPTP